MTEKEQKEITEQNREFAYPAGKIVFRVPGEFVNQQGQTVTFGYALVVKPAGSKGYNIDENTFAALIHIYEHVPELHEFLSKTPHPEEIKPRALFQS